VTESKYSQFIRDALIANKGNTLLVSGAVVTYFGISFTETFAHIDAVLADMVPENDDIGDWNPID